MNLSQCCVLGNADLDYQVSIRNCMHVKFYLLNIRLPSHVLPSLTVIYLIVRRETSAEEPLLLRKERQENVSLSLVSRQ